AGDARHRDALRVHLGPADQVVDAAHAVPALDPRRREAGHAPPPAALDRGLALDAVRAEVPGRRAVGAVVHAGDLAQLERVEDQADVAGGGEPHAVVLEGRLVAVAAATRVSPIRTPPARPCPASGCRRSWGPCSPPRSPGRRAAATARRTAPARSSPR